MATSIDLRLAPVTARDGVDTRKQDMTTSVGVTHVLEYLLPPGADVIGSRMNSIWRNYMSHAEAYIKGDPLKFFIFTSFQYQQGFNEKAIQSECSADDKMRNVYRQLYNAEVTDYKRSPSETTFKCAMEFLADFNGDEDDDGTGTLIAEEDEEEECSNCSEHRMSDWTNLCADCYWEEDAAIKHASRANRAHAMV